MVYGTNYTREFFINHDDNVLVGRLEAEGTVTLNFDVRFTSKQGGTSVAENDNTLKLCGEVSDNQLKYASYIIVVPEITSGEVTSATETMALVEAMADFGNFATAYFADETTGETPELPELPELTADDMTYLEGNKGVVTEDEDSIYYGSSLLLKSNTILRHYFTEEVEGSTQKGNLYYIDSEGIPAHNLGKELITRVGDMEISYNPLSYAYIALSREGVDEELKSVVHAMYLYYQAAQAYVEANK